MAHTSRRLSASGIVVDPQPRFDLSPNLYSQFMEPLGTTDGSVEACWDHLADDWRKDFVEVTKALSPSLIRWGGCFSSYYRWREAVGPRHARVPMYNILWRGIESNQVGTHEFVDLCRRTGSTPFYCVNFESDGRKHWARIPKWGVRSAGPDEAAAWVDYCNNPDNRERKRNGAARPFNLKLWQLGNETSYDPKGYDCETAARRTIAFAKAMRKVDPDLTFIGWGDSDWAPRMIEAAGEHLDYIAFHNGYRSTLKNPPFADNLYRRDPDATWEHLMTGAAWAAQKLGTMRQQTEGTGIPLALTESHYGSVPGLNRGRIFTTWAMGAAYARILNLYERNGDALKIAIICDYAGTRWMCNGVIVPEHYARTFMMPVTHVTSLFSHHTGRKALTVSRAPGSLDVTASRTGGTVFLHVVNTSRTRSVKARLHVEGKKITEGTVFSISVESDFEIFNRDSSDALEPVEKSLPGSREWTFPGASVTAIALKVGA
jgi:alpha-L-arabinofuranosidase